MPRLSLFSLLAFVAVLAGPVRLLAGPDHIEDGDAGSLIGSAQTVYKNVLILQKIYGQLGGVRADFEDMYAINIVDPAGFSARTDGVDGSFAEFDSQLWLFRVQGGSAFGLLGNDNFGPSNGSLILPLATDGTGQAIPGPGTYLLAISQRGSEPVSAGGRVFDFTMPMEISGPDGPGGLQPHNAWTVPALPESGNYVISLTGAEGFPVVPGMSYSGVIVLCAVLSASGGLLLRYRLST